MIRKIRAKEERFMISKMHLALNDLKEDLSKTPLLIGWLIIGPIVAF